MNFTKFLKLALTANKKFNFILLKDKVNEEFIIRLS